MANFEQVLSSIKDLSIEQLEQLEEELAIHKEKHFEKIKEVQKFAKQLGLELDEAMLKPVSTDSVVADGRSKVEPKYRYVDENGKEYLWSGRGVSPQWARKARDEGTLEQYLI
jgi:DNA-binding protein H-NS